MADETYPNEVIKNIYERRSVRGYLDKPVAREIIERVIEAGSMAPSVLNSQPWHFTVYQGDRREDVFKHMRRTLRYLEDMLPVLDDNEREAFVKSHEDETEQKRVMEFFENLGGAPVVIAVTKKRIRNDVNRRMALIACGGAIQNMELAASSLGLATCCVGSALWIEEDLMQEIGGGDDELVTILILGYPAYKASKTSRKKDIISWIGP